MSTAFGPQSPYYTTTRPGTDTAVSGGLDTWFKDCSAPGAKDGTLVTASFLNNMLGNLRYVVRAAGVSLVDGDDTMLFQAIAAVVADAGYTAGAGIAITSNVISDNLGAGIRPVLTA